MMTLSDTPTNKTKVDQLEAAMAEILSESLRRGFYGKAAIELAIQDGTIQHIRRLIERIDK
ncbi:MAG TPA: hypothetical protein VHX65_19030 [Pirellulales bacterium]|jgi:hypothetical protein|nr:hypothetical protein [Pirellulales bacterium]